ncbi:MAG: sulfite exporter TauE/SafE family protein [Chloroflexi bacterium]|nr:sulfite exporter TauE/SafE family protein [Chloroflexota bacterium]
MPIAGAFSTGCHLKMLVFIIVFLAIFTQTLAGFGLALVSMPLLVPLLGIQVAAPLVALVAVTAESVLLFRYRAHLTIAPVWRLVLASIFGVPLGVIGLSHLDEDLVVMALGIVVTGYALYALLEFHLPAVEMPRWAYGFGFFAGVLGGAYNTAGPPVVIYGACRRWEPGTFKGNLQGFFLVNSIAIIVSHGVNQNFTPEVWGYFLVVLPAIALGLLGGFYLERHISAVRFRQGVLGLLLILGLQLLFL